jgi:putative ABC transport system permease protein
MYWIHRLFRRSTLWLEDFVRDIGYGLRLLRRRPVVTCAAILSLALGIGANTAIFSLMDLVMLRMMPVREPARLVQFTKVTSSGRGSFSYPLFQQLQRSLKSFDGLFAHWWAGRREINIGGSPETVNLELVSGSYYEVLGAGSAVGSTFSRDVDRAPGASPFAVISHNFWSRQFGSDPAVIGRTFQLNQTIFTIIGVTPPKFFGVIVGRAPDITIPLSMEAAARGGRGSSLLAKNRAYLSVMGRLGPGICIDKASAEAATLFAAINKAEAEETDREPLQRAILDQRITLAASGNGFDELRTRFSQPLAILMGIVALVLVIACANVANLLLAKAAMRQREIAIRLAIGAGRRRVVQQLLTESLLLSVMGGAIGVLLAFWFSNGLITVMSNGGPRMALEPQIDGRMLSFATLASVTACVLFGIAPAILASRPDLHPPLSEVRGRRWRLGEALIVAQVAISIPLLIGAGLFGRTLLNMYLLDPGFDSRNVLLFSVSTDKAGIFADKLHDVEARLLSELKTLPGVMSASFTLLPPISGGGFDVKLFVQGHIQVPDEDDKSYLNAVGPNYFKTMGTPVLIGRDFDDRDTSASPRVAIVNERFAKYYFKADTPIGKWISWEGPSRGHEEIVGVVKDAKYRSLRQEVPRTAFEFAVRSDGGRSHTFIVRSRARPQEMTRMAQAALSRIDERLRLLDPRSLEEHISRSMLQERMLATLSGAFGGLALALSCVGIYGVMAFQVARRRKEIGIRLALGARPGTVVRMIVGQTTRLALVGSIIGVACALALTRIAAKMLFSIKPTDPLTFGLAVGALALVATTAAYLPGRNAARLNPVETLNCD